MAEEVERTVARIFEQPDDAISFYSDLTGVVTTGEETIVQFYETIPGSPGAGDGPTEVRTRLRATVMLSHPHAQRLGDLLSKRASGE